MSDPGAIPKPIADPARYLDDRTGIGRFAGRNIRKIFPDHWSFMLGEIALYSFIILLLTGTFLTFWFKPGMTPVVYEGTYEPLRGVLVSEAYASALNISFDVRGGLLMRQIHHWGALLFVAGLTVHLLRVFFTGAYRKPRELNWHIGLAMFLLALAEGLTGYSLPDDLLSGVGLRIAQGIAQSLPLVGTYISFFLFGGEFPGEDIIARFFTIHILLLPGLLVALVTAHMTLMWVQKHTQMAGVGRTDSNVVGAPFFPAFAIKTGAFFMFTFAFLALLGTAAQINPIWSYGPYTPADISAGSQPDFYLGFLDGALRLMPGWEINFAGYTLPLSVIIPGLVPVLIIFTGLALYPSVERWITGDRAEHHIAQRPRDNPHRTAIGVAAIVFYGVLWLIGANDEISTHFHLSLFAITWAGRVAVILGPILAYFFTYRICLGLRRKDARMIVHGVESGVIRRLPHGEFTEVDVPPSEDMADRVTGGEAIPTLGDGDGDASGKRRVGRLRARMSRAYGEETITEEAERLEGDGHGDRHDDGRGDGHGDGHGAERAGEITRRDR
ncbi:cytochrome bc complex cytochrome b subunit [Spongiactinospora sp. TRM90649]|uniref:cytochrome bc1 complex cytochrome b subunit n=1 Tax=Spongiactinospora sp. TRM90649 TaxID=3031114 RepID=UPI0023F9FE99|nr:cytochrome bc complex cytochrome b subunit [Spongiactinospora sp. TRM90649]MDF5754446.1 cytochrome bc complex cytochrome b subunit [Spongiactinospora sp. TRM90649]